MTYKNMIIGLIGIATAGSVAFVPLAFARNDTSERSVPKSEMKSAHAGVLININPSGNVQVQGATVTALSGSTLTATTVWGSTVLSWTIVTSSSTQLVNNNKKSDDNRGLMTLADIKVGDTVNFQGSLATGNAGLTVNARVVRDQSITTSRVVSVQKDIFQGTLQSIASTTAPTSLTMKSGQTLFTVTIPASATVLKSNFSATTLSTFQIGDTVRVYGSIETTHPTTINALVVRDATR